MLQPENIDTLKVIGKWLETYGETYYGTTKGPIKPRDWGATTQKGNTIYLHLMDLDDETLLMPEYKAKIKSVTLFDDKSALKFSQNEFGTLIRIPYSKRKPVDTILVIELK